MEEEEEEEGQEEAREGGWEWLGEANCVQTPVFYQSKWRSRSNGVAFGGSSGTFTDRNA